MRIAIGCDHRGLNTKHLVIEHATGKGHQCQDFGCFTTDPVDYPDIARDVASAVARGDFERGILICDTGIGMSISANKIKGIRAALCHDSFGAERCRRHNDANVLCLGTQEEPRRLDDIVNSFLQTSFEGGRHIARLGKIRALES